MNECSREVHIYRENYDLDSSCSSGAKIDIS